jgi:antitoxin ParD1/3/4
MVISTIILILKNEYPPFSPNTLIIKNLGNSQYFINFDINMNENTTISLGSNFDQFVQRQISSGRYKNVSEVIEAGLKLLENEESQIIALKDAIKEGLDSPRVNDFDFDFDKNLAELKAKKK